MIRRRRRKKTIVWQVAGMLHDIIDSAPSLVCLRERLVDISRDNQAWEDLAELEKSYAKTARLIERKIVSIKLG